jgi:2-polyprenyl-3-methyl-5-hydroxy-6-metoxy-1,4-benzoquinol methylase
VASEEIYTSGKYIENNPTWHVEDSPWKAKHILNIIKKNGLRPKSVGEIGCGAGEILHELLLQMDRDVSFVGYELSPQAFELCKQREADRLKYKLTNALDDENVFYDVVMAIDVVEHIEDYFNFLRQMRKRGEYKIFHVPLEMSVVKVLASSYLLKSRRKSGHIQYFNKETILATLQDTGYEIMDCFYTGGSSELASARNWENMLLKLPRKILYKINKDMTVKLLGGYSLMVLAK